MKKTSEINVDGLQEAVKTLKFLSNDKLLPILCRLGQEEIAAGDLAAFVDMSPSALSQHLKRLKEHNIVTSRRDHRVIYYRLSDPKTAEIIALLHKLYCNP